MTICVSTPPPPIFQMFPTSMDMVNNVLLSTPFECYALSATENHDFILKLPIEVGFKSPMKRHLQNIMSLGKGKIITVL